MDATKSMRISRRYWLGACAAGLGGATLWTCAPAEAAAEDRPAQASSHPTPQVWMAALNLPPDLALRTAEWSFVLKHLDGFKFWSAQIDWNAHDAVGKLARVLAEHRIAAASERMYWPPLKKEGQSDISHGEAGPLDQTVGERAARNEIRRITAYGQMGGRLAFVDVDDPMRNLIHPRWPASFGGGLTPDDAVHEFVDYMAGVAEQQPDVGFFVIVNFPLWAWKGAPSYVGNEFLGDYFPLVEKIVLQAREKKVPLRGWTVDFPREFAAGELKAAWLAGPPWDPSKVDWIARILDLERLVNERGLEFNLVINDGGAGERSQSEHGRGTLAYLRMYQQRGGRPHRYIVQSWFTHPTAEELLPETNPNTLTGLVRAVIQEVNYPPTHTSSD
jgi:hypothetical protein